SKKSVGIIMKLRLVLITKFDDFFKRSNTFSGSSKEKLCTMEIIKTIKSAGISKTFQRFFIHSSLVHSFDHVKNRRESSILFSFFNNVFNCRFSHPFHTAETKPDLTFFIYRKSFL